MLSAADCWREGLCAASVAKGCHPCGPTSLLSTCRSMLCSTMRTCCPTKHSACGEPGCSFAAGLLAPPTHRGQASIPGLPPACQTRRPLARRLDIIRPLPRLQAEQRRPPQLAAAAAVCDGAELPPAAGGRAGAPARLLLERGQGRQGL